MTDTPSPTPEEIEAAARAIYEEDRKKARFHPPLPPWEDLFLVTKNGYCGNAAAALKAAMAVRRGEVIDYRKMLMEYILHINDCMNEDFLSAYWLIPKKFPNLTDEENEALKICAQEASTRYVPTTGDLDDALEDAIQDVTIPETPLMTALRKGK